jgi:hypothetical protein
MKASVARGEAEKFRKKRRDLAPRVPGLIPAAEQEYALLLASLREMLKKIVETVREGLDSALSDSAPATGNAEAFFGRNEPLFSVYGKCLGYAAKLSETEGALLRSLKEGASAPELETLKDEDMEMLERFLAGYRNRAR